MCVHALGDGFPGPRQVPPLLQVVDVLVALDPVRHAVVRHPPARRGDHPHQSHTTSARGGESWHHAGKKSAPLNRLERMQRGNAEETRVWW